MPRRRSTDPEDSDYTSNRGFFNRTTNGHTRWVVGVVSAAIVSALAALLWADWTDIRTKIHNHELSIVVMEKNIEQIKEDVTDIKRSVRRLAERE